MPIFKSRQPDIDVPANLTTWDWLFDSPHSPLARFPSAELAGYEDAITGERLDWAQVKRATTYLSTALVRKHGLRAGETVSLFSQNTIWYPIAMHGALRAGAQVSGASPAYSVDEMAYALRTAKARFLLTGPASLDVAVKAAEKAGLAKERVFLLEGEVEGFQTVKGLIEVMISHQNVIAQCLQIQQITPADHTKVLAVLPSFHITGLVHVLHLPVLINASVIMLPTFTMPSMLEAIQRHQIGELLLVPPILIRLVRDPIVDRYDLSCVRRFSSGAAPLSAEILALLKQKFPGTGFKQGYGMTESCSCITAHPPHLYSFAHAHTVGTVVAGTEVKIVAPDGREAGVGEPGEILARGPQVVMGYLDNAAATAETFGAGGWLRTGDQGAIDRDGVVTILDRIKEMIKVKGIGVAPAELEDLLLGHAAVEDAAVLGVPDDYAGEVPKAYVVLKEGVEPAEAAGRELLAYVRASKVAYKRVREVEFVDEIPKSASGKILRRVLREGKGKGVVVREAVKEKAML
ncbi:putative 4-coumarate- ligase protein [Neofusicoccum parvum UCRNP2]|uniref:Putative 4-coumarate-ligase protein n=1 Tax=Botryosphaeria parva (strain UCR-NP2) TaxID=1287680 RepID=R1E9L3_BOTPV|nr:putative 4-coumarate- ligase protein [Neofusicoccum parvum UCRNP2]